MAHTNEPIEKLINDLLDLVAGGLYVDGAQHKQWYLQKIAKVCCAHSGDKFYDDWEKDLIKLNGMFNEGEKP